MYSNPRLRRVSYTLHSLHSSGILFSYDHPMNVSTWYSKARNSSLMRSSSSSAFALQSSFPNTFWSLYSMTEPVCCGLIFSIARWYAHYIAFWTLGSGVVVFDLLPYLEVYFRALCRSSWIAFRGHFLRNRSLWLQVRFFVTGRTWRLRFDGKIIPRGVWQKLRWARWSSWRRSVWLQHVFGSLARLVWRGPELRRMCTFSRHLDDRMQNGAVWGRKMID